MRTGPVYAEAIAKASSSPFSATALGWVHSALAASFARDYLDMQNACTIIINTRARKSYESLLNKRIYPFVSHREGLIRVFACSTNQITRFHPEHEFIELIIEYYATLPSKGPPYKEERYKYCNQILYAFPAFSHPNLV